jgi:hypothetical protein
MRSGVSSYWTSPMRERIACHGRDGERYGCVAQTILSARAGKIACATRYDVSDGPGAWRSLIEALTAAESQAAVPVPQVLRSLPRNRVARLAAG